MSASWLIAPCPATGTAPECCGFAPHCVQNGAFEAGSGGPLGPPSPPPLLFPFDWLESLLPPPQAFIRATRITIKQICRKCFMGGLRELPAQLIEIHLL